MRRDKMIIIDWYIITMMRVPYIENIWWPSMKGCVPWIISNYLFIKYIYTLYYKYHVIYIWNNVFPMLSKHQHSLSTRKKLFIMPNIVSEVYKLHSTLMKHPSQSWEMSLSRLSLWANWISLRSCSLWVCIFDHFESILFLVMIKEGLHVGPFIKSTPL